MPHDKRQMYEFDIRVPLMVRGPGVLKGAVNKVCSAVQTLAISCSHIVVHGHVYFPESDPQH